MVLKVLQWELRTRRRIEGEGWGEEGGWMWDGPGLKSLTDDNLPTGNP